MINFRKEFDPDKRFKARDEIKQIIQGQLMEDNTALTESICQLILDEANAELANDKYSRQARLKKVWAAALLRDFRYGNRNYKFLKGVGLNGLYVENYKSSDKIDTL